MTNQLNRLQQYIAKASFAHSADKNAALELAAGLGGTPSGRSEELITQLEAEIVKRDARIEELIGARDHVRLHASMQAQEARTQHAIVMEIGRLVGCDKDWLVAGAVRDALKAQQPSAGVVLPERFEMAPYQTVDKGSTNYKAGFNAGLREVARLNPCRAQAVQTVPDGKICVTATALYEVLYALVNAPHQIRELQATREPAELFADNPINVLVAEYKAAQQKESE